MLSRRGPAARALACVTAACAGLAGFLALAAPPAAADAGGISQSQQWVLSMLGAPGAWTVSRGQGVTVAVLDSGVVPGVSSLAGSVTSGPDLTGTDTPPDNSDWGQHGTWMASIIAGHGTGGVTGVAPDASILSVRVIPDRNDPGYGAYDRERGSRIQQALATGIRYAVDHGAQVISMSIGYAEPSAVVRLALQDASRHGVVVVASSGNSGTSGFDRHHGYAPFAFPADYPGVIGVAAVHADGTAASFSSGNLSVLVAAPGVNIPAQGRDGRYWLVSGTSPACALVAGVAALIKSRYPHLAPALVARAMTSTTRYRPAGGYDGSVGFGTVDAAAALSAAGQLAREYGTQPGGARGHGHAGVAAAEVFGGGPAAVPPPPVSSRGPGWLILFAALALASLALTAAGAGRLAVLRRTRQGYAGVPAAGGEGVPAAGPPPGAGFPPAGCGRDGHGHRYTGGS